MYQKAGRPDKIGKPKHKGGIAESLNDTLKRMKKEMS